jgi:hypothetical protein
MSHKQSKRARQPGAITIPATQHLSDRQALRTFLKIASNPNATVRVERLSALAGTSACGGGSGI